MMFITTIERTRGGTLSSAHTCSAISIFFNASWMMEPAADQQMVEHSAGE